MPQIRRFPTPSAYGECCDEDLAAGEDAALCRWRSGRCSVAALGVAVAAAAQSWSVGVGVGYGGPVYYDPPPSIYEPPPSSTAAASVYGAVASIVLRDFARRGVRCARDAGLSASSARWRFRGGVYRLNAVNPRGDLVALEVSVFTGEIERELILEPRRTSRRRLLRRAAAEVLPRRGPAAPMRSRRSRSRCIGTRRSARRLLTRSAGMGRRVAGLSVYSAEPRRCVNRG